MATFFHNILTFAFAVTFYAFVACLSAGLPGYQARANGGYAGFLWVLWFLGAILTLIVLVKLMFGI